MVAIVEVAAAADLAEVPLAAAAGIVAGDQHCWRRYLATPDAGD